MAFQQHLNVDEGTLAALADPGGPDLAAEELRPQLEQLANLELNDPLMATLVAQQVVVDLCSRGPADFAAPAELASWLEIRLAQTMALFGGMLGDVAVSAGQGPPPRRPARPWLRRSRWGILGGVPAIVGATSVASVLAAAGAVVVTLGTTYGPSTPAQQLLPVVQSPLGPRAVQATAPPTASPPPPRPTPAVKQAPQPAPVSLPLAVTVPAGRSSQPSTSPSPSPTPGNHGGSGGTPTPTPTPPPTTTPTPPPTPKTTPAPTPNSSCPTSDRSPCQRPDQDGDQGRDEDRDRGPCHHEGDVQRSADASRPGGSPAASVSVAALSPSAPAGPKSDGIGVKTTTPGAPPRSAIGSGSQVGDRPGGERSRGGQSAGFGQGHGSEHAASGRR